MNEALEDTYESEKRSYLGASGIGTACERRLWNQFHWAGDDTFSAKSIKAIADGHYSERVMAERLRLVAGVELLTEDEDGRQFNFRDGHIRGNLDGIIGGIAHLPNEQHVWEHKCVNEVKFNKLVKLTVDDETTALYEWDEQYYAQAQIYMRYFKMRWHYLTVCAPGSRDETSCITAYDPKAAEFYRDRAIRVINADRPPPRISETAAWFQCKICPYTENCHGEQMPNMNCRTCAYSTSEIDGTWNCEFYAKELTEQEQRIGCHEHLFNPGLIPAEQIDSGDGWIDYKLPNGNVIRNENASITTISTGSG